MISTEVSLPRGAVRVQPASDVDGEITAPGSKSMTIRMVTLAAMAQGRSILKDPLVADDTVATRSAMSALGARIDDVDGGWVVDGIGGAPWRPSSAVDCRLSGTTLRVVTAVAAAAAGPVVVTGAPPLLRRPIGPLVAALRDLGADVADHDGFPPVRLGGGGLGGGRVTVDVSRSSQFASALLMAAPLARAPVEVQAVGASASAYIDLTVEALRRTGVTVDARPSHWRVEPGLPAACDMAIEHDASAACHLLAFAAATGGTLTVTNAAWTTQPDAALTDVLAAMGCTVVRDGDRLSVSGPDRLNSVDVDLSTMPDQVTTIAVLAALADGDTHIRGVGVTRGHETDRLAALAAELGKLGVRVTEEPDGLRIRGGTANGPARLATYDDHRLAMAFASLGAVVDGVVIEEADCVRKTYPAFWKDLATLGITWEDEA